MNKLSIPYYVKVVFWMSLSVLVVFFIRNKVIATPIHDTLLLNLFHGFLPLVFAFVLSHFYDKIPNFIFWLVSLVWVLYYPNSPYMISDFKHLAQDPAAYQNYDTLIIFAFAMLSLFYGLLSLKIMYALFTKKRNKRFANIAIISTLLLSCLGYYMGRVLFLFSADFFKNPLKVLKEVWEHLWPISQNLSTYSLMLLFGGVQLMLIIMMKDVNDIESRNKI